MPDVVAQETAIKPFFDALRSSKAGRTVGLLIGKANLPPKLIVCAAIPAPPPPADDDGDDQSNGNSNSNSSSLIDGEWLAEQGRQMAEMLASGLNVIGVFLHGPSKELESNLSTLSSATRALSGSVILHSDSTRSSISTKFLDSSKAGSRPVTCPFSMDKVFPSVIVATGRVPVDASTLYSSSPGFKSAIQSAVSQFRARIMSSRIILDGCIIDSSSEDLSLSKWLKKVGIASDGKDLKASLLIPAEMRVDHRVGVELDVRGQLHLMGSVAVRAVIHSKETMARVAELLKQDAIASLQRRVSLAAEEAAAGGGEPGWMCLNLGKAAKDTSSEEHKQELEESSWSAALPVRVTVEDGTLPSGAISDYALPDDTEEEIRSRLEEIAAETFKESPLVWSEIVSRPSVEAKSQAGPTAATAARKESSGWRLSMNSLWIFIAILVALASLIMGRVSKALN